MKTCEIFWGSHGCVLAIGHKGQHLCDCCAINDFAHMQAHWNATADQYGANGCAATWPYYGSKNMAGENPSLPFFVDTDKGFKNVPEEFTRMAYAGKTFDK